MSIRNSRSAIHFYVGYFILISSAISLCWYGFPIKETLLFSYILWAAYKGYSIVSSTVSAFFLNVRVGYRNMSDAIIGSAQRALLIFLVKLVLGLIVGVLGGGIISEILFYMSSTFGSASDSGRDQ
jgi:uncharacterized membrane protein